MRERVRIISYFFSASSHSIRLREHIKKEFHPQVVLKKVIRRKKTSQETVGEASLAKKGHNPDILTP